MTKVVCIRVQAQWSSKMAIRSNTLIFTFDPASPRITAHDIREWLHAEIRIQEQKVQMFEKLMVLKDMYMSN